MKHIGIRRKQGTDLMPISVVEEVYYCLVFACHLEYRPCNALLQELPKAQQQDANPKARKENFLVCSLLNSSFILALSLRTKT